MKGKPRRPAHRSAGSGDCLVIAGSRPPERPMALRDGIGTSAADVLERAVIECEELAALDRAHVPDREHHHDSPARGADREPSRMDGCSDRVVALELSRKSVSKARHFRSPSYLSLSSPDLTAAAIGPETAATDDWAATAGSAPGSWPSARLWRWPTARSEAVRPAASRRFLPRLPQEPRQPRPAEWGIDRTQARRRHQSLDHLPASSDLLPRLAARDAGRLSMLLSTPGPGSARGRSGKAAGGGGQGS